MENADLLKILIARMTTIVSDIQEMKVTSAKQEENLKLHMKRSDALEEYVSKLDAKIESDIKPLQRSKAMVEGGLKVFGAIATFASIAIGIVKMYEMFKH